MKLFPVPQPGRRTISVLAGAALLLIGSASFAGAAGGSGHTRPAIAESPPVAGQSSGGVCRVGYDTETNPLSPPDDSPADNTAAATVTLSKPCPGVVIGRFTSEVGTSANGHVDIEMRATCTGKGGFTSPCTVGQQVIALPGDSFFQNNSGFGGETNAMDMVWPGLKRGVWKFEVLPGGDPSSFVEFRTFTVTAFTGG